MFYKTGLLSRGLTIERGLTFQYLRYVLLLEMNQLTNPQTLDKYFLFDKMLPQSVVELSCFCYGKSSSHRIEHARISPSNLVGRCALETYLLRGTISKLLSNISGNNFVMSVKFVKILMFLSLKLCTVFQ